MENFNILEERENPLFNRKKLKLSVTADVTPSHVDVEKFISEKFSVEPEKVKIKKIAGKFGSRNFIITANIYSSKDHKDKTEPKSKKEKKK